LFKCQTNKRHKAVGYGFVRRRVKKRLRERLPDRPDSERTPFVGARFGIRRGEAGGVDFENRRGVHKAR